MAIHAASKEVPTAVVTLMLILAGVGAAAGVTVAGSIDGELTTEVDQAIVVDRDAPGTVQTDKDSLVTVNDEGTEFRTTAGIHQGDDYDIVINFSYNGQTDTNAEMTLDIPEGINADVVAAGDLENIDPSYVDDGNAADNVSVGQVAQDTWLLKIEGNDGATEDGFAFQLGFEIDTTNNVEPGFYTIDGELYPVGV